LNQRTEANEEKQREVTMMGVDIGGPPGVDVISGFEALLVHSASIYSISPFVFVHRSRNTSKTFESTNHLKNKATNTKSNWGFLSCFVIKGIAVCMHTYLLEISPISLFRRERSTREGFSRREKKNCYCERTGSGATEQKKRDWFDPSPLRNRSVGGSFAITQRLSAGVRLYNIFEIYLTIICYKRWRIELY